MKQIRFDGRYLLVFGGLILLLFGIPLNYSSPIPITDFRAAYYSGRCLLHSCDPYKESDVLRTYQDEGGDFPLDSAGMRQVVAEYVYPPTAFAFTIPFAMLPWKIACALWIALLVSSVIIASFLIWDLGADYAPVLSSSLIAFLLANSVLVVIIGNPAGFAVGLCCVAVWCFLRDRLLPVGILCLATSLVVKPQDAGLVWLYFLLAGGAYRKRALQTVLVAAALSLPAVLWVGHVAPNWMHEISSNIAEYSAHGGINDPGPASAGRGIGMPVSLQRVISAIWDDPRIYNPASYLICAPLLLIWAFVTLRTRPSPSRTLLAIAAIAALSMMPVYHRQYDAKLIVLAVPACAMLWAEGGPIGWAALLLNGAAFLLIADLLWAIFFGAIGNLHLPAAGLPGQVIAALPVFPTPIILLAMGIFYLIVYVRRSSADAHPGHFEAAPGTPEFRSAPIPKMP
jgi:hypothetical protein